MWNSFVGNVTSPWHKSHMSPLHRQQEKPILRCQKFNQLKLSLFFLNFVAITPPLQWWTYHGSVNPWFNFVFICCLFGCFLYCMIMSIKQKKVKIWWRPKLSHKMHVLWWTSALGLKLFKPAYFSPLSLRFTTMV